MAMVTHQLAMPDGSIPVNASVRIRLVAAISGSSEGHVLGAASIGGVSYQAAYLQAAGYAVYGGGGTATDDIYNGLIDTVVGRFPADQSIVTLDLNAAGWNPATMIGSTGQSIHFGDPGAGFIADQIVAKLNTLPSRYGLLSV